MNPNNIDDSREIVKGLKDVRLTNLERQQVGDPAGIGACDKPCAHTECAKLHRIAVTVCRNCGSWIGYGEPYYEKAPEVYVHKNC